VASSSPIRPRKSRKTGDRVLFGKYAATEYTIGDEKLYVMKEDDIIAIV
jgi:chaperonin GroES